MIVADHIIEIIDDNFTPEMLEVMPADEREILFQELSRKLSILVQKIDNFQDYQHFLMHIIKRLKASRHDIWSVDYNSESETWGGNYMNPETAGKLLIQFEFKTQVKFDWYNWNEG